MATNEDREQLQNLHLTLEAAIEQLTYALGHASRGTEIGMPSSPEVQAIERALGEITTLRNQLREKLMKVLSKPALGVIK